MIRTNLSRFILVGTITEFQDNYIIITLGNDDTKVEVPFKYSQARITGRKVAVIGTIKGKKLIAEEIRGLAYGTVSDYKTPIIRF